MSFSKEQILARIRDAGVVGAGGAGFPTHVKYQAQVDMVIANGAECEPLIRVDQQLMAEQPALLLRGLSIAMDLTGAGQGVIGLKAKYHSAIEALEEQIRLSGLGDSISIHQMGNYYPAGDEFVLVREVTGRAIPEFGLPLHVGVVVSNVSTLVDVARAVDLEQPVTTRAVTVSGDLPQPVTCEVPVGTPLSRLVQSAGGSLEPGRYLVSGGPMMGALVDDPEQEVVTKTTSAVLVFPEHHPVIQRRLRGLERQIHLTRAACLKCQMCTEVCPRNLLGHRLVPDRLMRNLAAGVTEDLEAFRGSYLCSECGLCAVYGCVMNLDPCAVNREMKSRLAAAGVERPQPVENPERVFGPMRKVPTARLIARLGLMAYDRPAPRTTFSDPGGPIYLPLSQHVGAPARPVVVVGQAVSVGEVVAEIPEDKLGARVHSSVAGTVVDVDDQRITIEVG